MTTLRTEFHARPTITERYRSASPGFPAATARRFVRVALLDTRIATLHFALFVAASATLFATGLVAAPGVAFWALVAWGGVATTDALVAFGRSLVSGSPESHPPVPAAGGVVMTGSIASTVKLDYDAGTAEKSYRPTRFVRLLYRLSFQAPFPYTVNPAAFQAAAHRRTVAGLLTKFWFDENMVAQALDIRGEDDGRYTLVTELIRGTAPRDPQRAKAMLRALTARFLEAGLPSWQVGHYNPRAIGNLLEQEDGSYRIIDLESNLVTPVLPPGALVRSIRNGQYPSFDDVDLPRLDAYLDANRNEIAAAIGAEETARLFEAAAAYGTAQAEWHGGERRIVSTVLRLAFRLIDVPSWIRGARRMTKGGQRLADGFIGSGINDWAAEGHLSDGEAGRLRAELATPEVASVTANLGAHMAMSVPLRFPLGSLARFGWTVVARAKAEWAALRGRASAKTARQIHTVPVALLGLVPGFGAGAYLLAKPLRANRTLAVIVFDRLLRKVPLGVYRRLHFAALMTWFARPATKAAGRPALRSIVAASRSRLAAVRPRWRIVAAVLAASGVALAGATVAHHAYHVSFAFGEFGLINSFDAFQLLAAGVLGILAFRAFWRGAAHRAPGDESAGIFLWGVTGLGLVAFAFDDFFGLHERVGAWITNNVGMMPLLTNNVDDFITLSYGVIGLAVLAIFRHELFAVRASSALLVAGVAAAALMLGTDAYGHGFVKWLEFPAQVFAGALLLLAHLTRYLEVRAALPRPIETAPAAAAVSPALPAASAG